MIKMKYDSEALKYRWVILFCCTVVNFLTWGALYSVGVFYMRWLDYFGACKYEVAVVGGMPTATGALLGPLFGALIDRIGFRKAGIVGGIILSLSHLMSSFAPSLAFLGLSYGFLAGAGAGLSNYASSVALNQYFKTGRAFSEGIMSTGVGFGNFVFTITYQELLNEYDWKGTMIILSGILGNVIPLFQLMITPHYLERFPSLRSWISNQTPRSKPQKEIDDTNLEQVENPVNNDDAFELEEEDVRSEIQVENMVVDDGILIKSEDDKTSQSGWLKSFTLRTWNLYKNPVFLLILIIDFLCWICLFVPYVHLAERSRLEGIDVNTAAWISSTIGLGTIFGRIVICGMVSYLKADAFNVYGVINQVTLHLARSVLRTAMPNRVLHGALVYYDNVLQGLAMILSPFFSTVAGLFVYSCTFGVLCVSYPLIKASAAHLLGTDIFPLAFSWMLLFEGAGISIGVPIAGWIYDVTKSYNISFYCMGTGLILSGLMVTLRRPAMRLRERTMRTK